MQYISMVLFLAFTFSWLDETTRSVKYTFSIQVWTVSIFCMKYKKTMKVTFLCFRPRFLFYMFLQGNVWFGKSRVGENFFSRPNICWVQGQTVNYFLCLKVLRTKYIPSNFWPRCVCQIDPVVNKKKYQKEHTHAEKKENLQQCILVSAFSGTASSFNLIVKNWTSQFSFQMLLLLSPFPLSDRNSLLRG